MPPALSAVGKRAWKRLTKSADRMGTMSEDGWVAMWALCSVYEDVHSASTLIRKDGIMAKGKRGGLQRKHPAIAIKHDALRILRTYLAEFGFTPAARTRVQVAATKDEGDPWDAL